MLLSKKMPLGFDSTTATTILTDADGKSINAPGLHVFGRSDQSPYNETRILTIPPSAMHVSAAGGSHRTEVSHVAFGVEQHPYNAAHLSQRQAIMGMRCTSNSSTLRFIYIPDIPCGEAWQITQIYLSFVSNSSFPMSPYHASVSVVSRTHDWSIVSENGTPSLDTHLTQHLAPTGSSEVTAGTNKWLTLTTPYTATTRSGSYLVAHVLLASTTSTATNCIFMGGSYLITRRT